MTTSQRWLGGIGLFLFLWWHADYNVGKQEIKELRQNIDQLSRHAFNSTTAQQVALAFSACRQAQAIPANKTLTREAVIAVACQDAEDALSRWQVLVEERSVLDDD